MLDSLPSMLFSMYPYAHTYIRHISHNSNVIKAYYGNLSKCYVYLQPLIKQILYAPKEDT